MTDRVSLARGFAHLAVTVLGLGLGALIGFIVALTTGLIRINIC